MTHPGVALGEVWRCWPIMAASRIETSLFSTLDSHTHTQLEVVLALRKSFECRLVDTQLPWLSTGSTMKSPHLLHKSKAFTNTSSAIDSQPVLPPNGLRATLQSSTTSSSKRRFSSIASTQPSSPPSMHQTQFGFPLIPLWSAHISSAHASLPKFQSPSIEDQSNAPYPIPRRVWDRKK